MESRPLRNHEITNPLMHPPNYQALDQPAHSSATANGVRQSDIDEDSLLGSPGERNMDATNQGAQSNSGSFHVESDEQEFTGIGQYDDFHTIDWQRDIARDRMRHRHIIKKKQESVWDWIKSGHDAWSGWLCVFMVGVIAGAVAGMIDIGSSWMSDLKFGICPEEFWFNKEQCCWSSEEAYNNGDNCSNWYQWPEVFGNSAEGAGAYIVSYFFYICWSILFGALAASLVKISDPVDCSVYYECGLSGTLPPQSCPSSMPHFDGEKCVNDESVCCKPSCEPYCEAEGIQVADPTDCTKYFICAPEPIYPPFSCPAGEFFDIGYGRCTETAECKAWCSATPSTPLISDSTPVNPVDTLPVNTDSTTPSNIATTTTPFIPTGTTTTPGDCITNLLCESSGFFPKCVTCQPEYFYCSADGEPAIEESCNGNLVFNPVPGYPYCILPGNCPYAPFEEYTRTYYTYVD